MLDTLTNPAQIFASEAVSRDPATDALIARCPYQNPEEVEAGGGDPASRTRVRSVSRPSASFSSGP